MVVINRAVLAGILVFFVSSAWANKDVVVSVKLSPAGSFELKTKDVTGSAIQNGDMVTAENIVVKLHNVKSGIGMRDTHTKEKYLEVEKYPEAILTKAVGKGGKGKGRIKIKGIEKDVSGEYSIEDGFLKAKFPLKISDFGITGVKYMGVGVKDEVVVNISVPLAKK